MPGALPQDTLVWSVLDSVKALKLGPQDAGAARLAQQYAVAIDADPTLLKDLGPRLLAVLAELGATPAARAKLPQQTAPAEDPRGAALAGLRLATG